MTPGCRTTTATQHPLLSLTNTERERELEWVVRRELVRRRLWEVQARDPVNSRMVHLYQVPVSSLKSWRVGWP
jgi:hypothetical protein